MAFNLSTGFVLALTGGTSKYDELVMADTISFGDGDGTDSTDTINDSGSGFGNFKVGHWVLIGAGTNNNVMAKVLTATSAKLEIEAGSLVAEAAGSIRSIANFGEGGSFLEILKNGSIDIYDTVRPAAGADAAEAGTKLLIVSLDGGAFVAGEPTNGLNLGVFDGLELKRALDPDTGLPEVWRGVGLVAGTAVSAVWYANDKVTGASTTAVRMHGTVATSGADLNMVNGTTVAVGIYSEFSDIAVNLTSV